MSYDQFLEFVDKKLTSHYKEGPVLMILYTLYKLPEYSKIIAEVASRHISQDVKDLVWNRDFGRCTKCGSNEKLEFDHIIPFSKGGSNTYRNIQLLCEPCNRTKLNKVG